MSGYQRSARRERETVKYLRDLGHVAYRTPASKGAADVVDLYHGNVSLIQIKTGGKSAFDHFGPAERERLVQEAAKAGGTPGLFWWPTGKPLEIIGADRWPDAP